MSSRKHDLMSAEETAQILNIKLQRLYNICNTFDARDDDQWDLVEGEHFEWLSRNIGTRRFYEEGAMAIARYIQEVDTAGRLAGFVDAVVEKMTNRRKKTRQMLVRRRVILEVKDLNDLVVRGGLVFVKREQQNFALSGREPMEKGVHFDTIENDEYWSQRGLVRIAQNMSENLAQKSRRAWTEAVAEVYEDAIEQQRIYLNSFDAKVQKAKDQVKALANKKCQVTLERQSPSKPFDMHVHHLFDCSTRPDLATVHENLLAMHEDLHKGFHSWHGSGSCEPKHFVEYLTTVEAWRFEQPKRMPSHLHQLINRLDKLQMTFESRYELCQQFK